MLTIRAATIEDTPVLFAMLRDSSAEQGFPDELVVSEQDLREDGFGAQPRFFALLAEWHAAPAGLALYYFNYSTWGSRKGLYLEDLYVGAGFRKKRIARALLEQLARIAMQEGCGRLQWVVHNENSGALRLYESVGARSLREWSLMSLKGDEIRELARGPLDETTSAP